MCWSRGSKEATVALQVEIKFGWVNHVSIHNGTSGTIPTPVSDVGREKSNVMAFPDNNDADLRVYSDLLASL
jgi:hypothetical protein